MFEEFEIRVVTAVTVVLNGFHKGGGVVGEIFSSRLTPDMHFALNVTKSVVPSTQFFLLILRKECEQNSI